MRKFQIGDIVQVTNCGAHYSGYEKWAKLHNMRKWKEQKWDHLDNLIKKYPKIQFKVIVVAPHSNGVSEILCGIECNTPSTEQFIVGQNGLKFYTDKSGRLVASVLEVDKNKYPHKCPDCQSPSWNNMFYANQIKCSSSKCKYYDKE